MTSSPPCWLTKTKYLSLASFIRPPEVVHFSIVIGFSIARGWLKTSYCCTWWTTPVFRFDLKPLKFTDNISKFVYECRELYVYVCNFDS